VGQFILTKSRSGAFAMRLRLICLLLGLPLTAAAGEARVVFLGDSITLRWGPAVYNLLPPDVDDAGVGGNTAQLMYARLPGILARRPETVVLLAGTNDVADEVYRAEAQSRSPMLDFSYVREIIFRCQSAGVRVVLGTIPPMLQPDREAQVLRWNGELKRIAAAYGVDVADYFTVFLKPDGTPNASLYISDGVHPVAAAFNRMLRVIKPILRAPAGLPEDFR